MDPVATPSSPVTVVRETIVLPTFLPAAPERNPMFLDKRVYQGSSGKVYPLPFTDRIAEEPRDVSWDAVSLENEFVRLSILPEIGGRIHVGYDKSAGFDFFYRQEVIKPALVGLAGPWISGGVEINWPQHHRPSTFMPTDVEIEEHSDGSKTVWLSEHEPMNRMKGMHGVCLHPGKALIELKARVYNRAETAQTFLWWANVATRAHERYQSFFPPDTYFVADHAKRSMSAFPLCQDSYYGVDYGRRGKEGVPLEELPAQFVPPGDYPPHDLSWYANIPVPTSYMRVATTDDFFGGYDHRAGAGVVHVANHHISPGKKQWTWGNQEFGYAWDRNLTEPDASGEYAPYIELMAGVYTDNQPDFSFLAPGETKTWSQYWYPIQKIGVPQKANRDAAVSLSADPHGIRVGVAVSQVLEGARVELRRAGADEAVKAWQLDLSPSQPFVGTVTDASQATVSDLAVIVSQGGRELIHYAPEPAETGPIPPPATEPPMPEEIASADELYLTGLHLHQYRHATRMPELYWREALRRDPGDARCNNAMGLWHLRRGEFEDAEGCFRRAVARLTARNPNPYDGEPHYNLGLALRHQGRREEAYATFYKATWNQAWQSAGYFAIAELDCCKGDWTTALEHFERVLRVNADHLKARNLRALVLRRLNRDAEADEALAATLALDPLDWWARYLLHGDASCDPQVRLDLTLDFTRSGFFAEATQLLLSESAGQNDDPRGLGTEPLTAYYLGWLYLTLGDGGTASEQFRSAAQARPDYCFPARLEEIEILNTAIKCNPDDGKALYYLGNLFYDRNRRREAIELWERAVALEAGFATTWRNLGIARYNTLGQGDVARAAYDRAFEADPFDARVLFERDQLWKRLGVGPDKRLAELEAHRDLVQRRDDLSVELCALYNQIGQPEQALAILEGRRFQPWEGGEGQTLGQHVRARLALGRQALDGGDARAALEHFEAARNSPRNLGEAKHLLANQSDVYYWIGVAREALGHKAAAKQAWQAAARARGDFQEMSVKRFSEMTYYSALSLRRLGQEAEARELLQALLAHAQQLEGETAKIDYFATSLPTMLVFDEDIQFRQETTAHFLQAQARLGLGEQELAAELLQQTLYRDPNHPFAADLANSV